MLGRELYRIALYADLVPTASPATVLRIFRSDPFLREDGHLVRLWIYFVLRPDEAVELQHIEAIEENMSAGG